MATDFDILIGVDMENAESDIKSSIDKIGKNYPLKIQAEFSNEKDLLNKIDKLQDALDKLQTFDLNLGLGDDTKQLKLVEQIVNRISGKNINIGDGLKKSLDEAKKASEDLAKQNKATEKSFKDVLKTSQKTVKSPKENKKVDTTKTGGQFVYNVTSVEINGKGDKKVTIEDVVDQKGFEKFSNDAQKKLKNINLIAKELPEEFASLQERFATLKKMFSEESPVFNEELKNTVNLLETFEDMNNVLKERNKILKQADTYLSRQNLSLVPEKERNNLQKQLTNLKANANKVEGGMTPSIVFDNQAVEKETKALIDETNKLVDLNKELVEKQKALDSLAKNLSKHTEKWRDNGKLTKKEIGSFEKSFQKINIHSETFLDDVKSVQDKFKELVKAEKDILEHEKAIEKIEKEKSKWVEKYNELKREGKTHSNTLRGFETQLNKLDKEKLTTVKAVDKQLNIISGRYDEIILKLKQEKELEKGKTNLRNARIEQFEKESKEINRLLDVQSKSVQDALDEEEKYRRQHNEAMAREARQRVEQESRELERLAQEQRRVTERRYQEQERLIIQQFEDEEEMGRQLTKNRIKQAEDEAKEVNRLINARAQVVQNALESEARYRQQHDEARAREERQRVESESRELDRLAEQQRRITERRYQEQERLIIQQVQDEESMSRQVRENAIKQAEEESRELNRQMEIRARQVQNALDAEERYRQQHNEARAREERQRADQESRELERMAEQQRRITERRYQEQERLIIQQVQDEEEMNRQIYQNRIKQAEDEAKEINRQMEIRAREVQSALDAQARYEREHNEARAREERQRADQESRELERLTRERESVLQRQRDAEERLGEQIGQAREKSELNRRVREQKEDRAQDDAVNRELERQWENQQRINRATQEFQDQIDDIQNTGFIERAELSNARTLISNLTSDSEELTRELREIQRELSRVQSLSNQRRRNNENIEFAQFKNRNSADDLQTRGVVPDYLINNFRMLNDMLDLNSSREDIEEVKRELKTLLDLEKQINQAGNEEGKIRDAIQRTRENILKATIKYDEKLDSISDNATRNLKDLQHQYDIENRIYDIRRMVTDFQEDGKELTIEQNRQLNEQLRLLRNTLNSYKDIESFGSRRENETLRLNDQFDSVAYRSTRGLDKHISEYNKLKDMADNIRVQIENLPNIDADKYEDAVKKIRKEMTELNRESQVTRDAIREKENSIIGQLGSALSKVPIWMTATTVFFGTMQQISQGVQYILEFDKAMTNLGKVTSATSEELEGFQDTASSMGKQLGVLATDVVNATTEFQKLGYSLQDSAQLGQNSIVYANVGDMPIEDATKYMTSAVKGFEVAQEDVVTKSRQFADIFNQVGNEYAIDSKGIGEALQRSSATLHEAGNTVEEAVALVTSANTTIQNPERVGNALKTVSMRIRGITEDGSGALDVLPKLQETLDKMNAKYGTTLNMMEADGTTFKSTYEFFDELSGVYDKFNDIDQANLLELIGGKEQGAIVASMINNWEDAQDSLITATQSAGSAQREYNAYMESFEYRIGKLKSALEEFWLTLVNEDAFKATIDFLTTTVELLTKIIDIMGSGAIFGQFGLILALLASPQLKEWVKTGKEVKGVFDGLAGAITTLLPIATRLFKLFGLASLVGIGSEILFNLAFGKENDRKEQIQSLEDDLTKIEDLNKRYEDLNVEEYVELEFKGSKMNNEELVRYQQLQEEIKKGMPELVSHYDEHGQAVLKDAEAIEELVKQKQDLAKTKESELLNLEIEDEDFSKIEGSIEKAQHFMSKLDEARGSKKVYSEVKGLISEDLINIDDRDSKEYEESVENIIKRINAKVKELNLDPIETSNLMQPVINSLRNGDIDSAIKHLDKNTKDANKVIKNSSKQFGDSKKEIKGSINDINNSVQGYAEQLVNSFANAKGIEVNSNDFSFIQDMKTAFVENIEQFAKDGDVNTALKNLPKLLEYAFANMDKKGIDINNLIELSSTEEGVISASKEIDKFSKSLNKNKKNQELLGLALNILKGRLNDVAKATQNVATAEMFKADVDESVNKYIDSMGELESAYNTLVNGEKLSIKQIYDLSSKYPELTKHVETHNGALSLSVEGVSELMDINEKQFKRDLEIKEQQGLASLERAKAEIESIYYIVQAEDMLNTARKKGLEETMKIYDAKMKEAIESGNIQGFTGMQRQRDEIKAQIESYVNLSDQIKALETLMNSDLKTNVSSTQKDTKEKDKQIYVTDKYKEALEALNLEIEKQQKLLKKYPEHSKEYINILNEEIKLQKEKMELLKSQEKSLKEQIASGKIQKTGLISIGEGQELVSNPSTSASSATVYNVNSRADGTVAGLTANDLKKYLKGDMSGTEGYIIKYAKQYGVNPLFLLSLMINETGRDGTSTNSKYFNYGNRKSVSGNWMKFDSKEEGVKELASYIQRKYLSKGVATIDGIHNIYAPKSDSRNSTWGKVITSIMNEITSALGNVAPAITEATSKTITSWNVPVTSKYGSRTHPVTGEKGKMHHGIDLAFKQGTELPSNISGEVVWAKAGSSPKGSGYSGYGGVVAVKDSSGNVHVYAHMSEVDVVKGQVVEAGNILGKTGGAKGTYGAGTSTGSHLHYEVRKNGELNNTIDPMQYVKDAKSGIVSQAGAVVSNDNVAETLQDIDGAKEALLDIQKQMLEQEDLISELEIQRIDAVVQGYEQKKLMYDQLMENSENRLSQMSSSSEAFRQELEKQRQTIANKQSYNDQEIKYLQGIIKNGGLTAKTIATYNEKLHELGLSKNEMIFKQQEISFKIISSIIEQAEENIDNLDYKLERLGKDQDLYVAGTKEWKQQNQELIKTLTYKTTAILNERNAIIKQMQTQSLSIEQQKELREKLEDLSLAYADVRNELQGVVDAEKEHQEKMADQIIETMKEAYEQQKELELSRLDFRLKSLDEEAEALEKQHQETMDRLDEELEMYEKIVQAKLKSMDREEEERGFEKEMEELEKQRKEIQDQMDELSLDDSFEAKKKKNDLSKQLDEVNNQIEEARYNRTNELRRNELEDDLEAYREQQENAKENAEFEIEIDGETHKGKLESLQDFIDEKREELEKEREEVEYHYDELIKNDRYYNSIREEILEGNLETSKNKLNEFLKAFTQSNKETIKEIGASWEALQNMIDKINDSKDTLKDGVLEGDREQYEDLEKSVELKTGSYSSFDDAMKMMEVLEKEYGAKNSQILFQDGVYRVASYFDDMERALKVRAKIIERGLTKTTPTPNYAVDPSELENSGQRLKSGTFTNESKAQDLAEILLKEYGASNVRVEETLQGYRAYGDFDSATRAEAVLKKLIERGLLGVGYTNPYESSYGAGTKEESNIKGYKLSTGTYSKKTEADEVANKLKSDYSAKNVTIKLEGMSYRVYGEFDERDRAEAVLNKLKERGLTGTGNIQSFDTGGYTGEWGRTGKLAVLHEKELVLNKEQTKNILQSARILDKLKNLLPNFNITGLFKGNASETAPISNSEHYEINVHVENMNGDRNSADIVAEQIVNRIKRTRGGRF